MTLSPQLKQAIAGTLVLLALAMPGTTLAQERLPENVITVQGQGAATAQPDAMQITIAVETQAKTAEAARADNARRMQAILDRLRALNIPKLQLQTTGFYVTPIYQPESEGRALLPRPRTPGTIIGYTVRNQINAKLEGADPNQLGSHASRILDTAIAAGANTVSGPNFYLSRDNAATREALRLAITQARQIAETAAQAAGVQLTGVFSIEAYSQPIAMRAEAAMLSADKAAPPTPVEPGTMEVTANVTVRYDFRD